MCCGCGVFRGGIRINHFGTFEARGEFGSRKLGLWSEGGWVWANVSDDWWLKAEARQNWLRVSDNFGYPPGWSYESRKADARSVERCADDAGWGPLRCLSDQDAKEGWRGEFVRPRIPHGILALLSGAWPLAWLALAGRRALRRRRRARAGRCLGCGYDLRASAERCPECGRAVPAR